GLGEEDHRRPIAPRVGGAGEGSRRRLDGGGAGGLAELAAHGGDDAGGERRVDGEDGKAASRRRPEQRAGRAAGGHGEEPAGAGLRESLDQEVRDARHRAGAVTIRAGRGPAPYGRAPSAGVPPRQRTRAGGSPRRARRTPSPAGRRRPPP